MIFYFLWLEYINRALREKSMHARKIEHILMKGQEKLVHVKGETLLTHS